MRGRLSSLILLAALVVASPTALSQDTPPTVEEVVGEVLAAGDVAALGDRLASVDPWRVAHELCLRGEFELATQVASTGGDRLVAYVAAARTRELPDVRARLQAVREAETPEAALAAIGELELADDVHLLELGALRGVALQRLRRLDEAAVAHTQVADVAQSLGWQTATLTALERATVALDMRGDSRNGLPLAERWLAAAREAGDRRHEGEAQVRVTGLAMSAGLYDQSVAAAESAVEIFTEIGDERGLQDAWNTLGVTHYHWRKDAEAEAAWIEARRLAEKLGDAAQQAGLTVNLGNLAKRRGDEATAMEAYARGAELAEAAGALQYQGIALGNLAGLQHAVGRYAEAMTTFERALAIAEQRRDLAATASCLANMGVVRTSQGDLDGALELQRRALEIQQRTGNRNAEFFSRRVLGMTEMHRGANARALAQFEAATDLARSNGNPGQIFEGLHWCAWVLDEMGASERAMALQAEAEKLARDAGHTPSISRALRLRARIETDPERSLELLQEGLALVGGGNQQDRQHLGVYLKDAGRHEEALAVFDELSAVLGDEPSLDGAKNLVNRGSSLTDLGRLGEAQETLRRALEMAESIGATRVAVKAVSELSRAHFVAGEHEQVVELATRSVALQPLLVTGLSEELVAKTREKHARLQEFGVRAAGILGDAERAFHLLESARGAALLEALGGRTRLRGDLVPAELAQQELAAQAAVRETQDRLRRAIASKKFKAVREAKQAHEEAQAALLDVVDRVQRTARSGAELAYPRAVAPEELQAVLRPGEAYVGLALAFDVLTAVVVTQDSLRVVSVEGANALEARADELLELRRSDYDATDAVRALRTVLVDRLELPESVRRVLVLPVAQLAYVPFALLLPDREVAYVPSGSTLVALRRNVASRGASILGVGDPDYSTGSGRATLQPLPGTRVEVDAIADVKLLGTDATEAGLLAAVGERERWRAIHLACHGLVHPSNPLLSSLALTSTDETDGFLTLHELFSARLPADLVVLSACETAKGDVYFSEGVMGFPRAVMIAGAPRTIVSLWKVDDEATSALMRKFYEVWNPEQGDGLSTAGALRAAQEHVRSQETWSHPYYWAAWTLWGLPE